MKPCLTLIGKSGMLTCRMSWYLNPYLFEALDWLPALHTMTAWQQHCCAVQLFTYDLSDFEST